MPKNEHTEGKRVRSRADGLLARANGLMKIGKTFVKVGLDATAVANGTANGTERHSDERDNLSSETSEAKLTSTCALFRF